jgi:hypothetical protein
VIIVIGLQFRSAIESGQDVIVGGILIATGLGFGIFELRGHGPHHHHDHSNADHDHDHDHEHRHERDDHNRPEAQHGLRGLAAIMVPFGAAASPDLTILPVVLAATSVGVGTAIGSLVVFGAVTIATIVGLTLGAARGGYQIRGQWLDRWGNTITAITLVVVGTLVLTGTI